MSQPSEQYASLMELCVTHVLKVAVFEKRNCDEKRKQYAVVAAERSSLSLVRQRKTGEVLELRQKTEISSLQDKNLHSA
jgi:hypothetical protein